MTEDERVRWNHQLDGHEFAQAPRIGEEQQALACCSPWGCKELDMTEQLNSALESHDLEENPSFAIPLTHPLLSPSPPAFNLSSIFPRSFPVSRLFTSGGQSIGASTSASVLPMTIQD